MLMSKRHAASNGTNAHQSRPILQMDELIHDSCRTVKQLAAMALLDMMAVCYATWRIRMLHT